MNIRQPSSFNSLLEEGSAKCVSYTRGIKEVLGDFIPWLLAAIGRARGRDRRRRRRRRLFQIRAADETADEGIDRKRAQRERAEQNNAGMGSLKIEHCNFDIQ